MSAPFAWILAYGSLADEAPADAPLVVVRGLRRAWNVAFDNAADLPGYKHYLLADGSRPACHVAFLDVVEDDTPGAAIDAVLYPVADRRALEALDRRERNYERVDARARVVDPPVDGPLWLYVGLPLSRDRAAAALTARTLRVSRRYADRCAAAFARRGADAADRYLASTAPWEALLEDLRRIDHPREVGSTTLHFMTSLDPRTPVLVGAAQRSHRREDGPVPAPHVFMADVAREAARDCAASAGPEDLLARVEVAASIDLFAWPVPDPAAVMAAELGISPRATVRTARGGNGPIALLGDLGSRIAGGELDVALISFAETFTPFRAALRGGPATDWPQQDEGTAPTWSVGTDHNASSPAETAAGLMAPVVYYPLFEHALRATAGRTREEQRAHAARIWERFAEVARANPHAWTRDPPGDAEALGTPSPSNRLVSDPYPKFLNANIAVDQGAALVLMSAAAAQDAGIPQERWVPVHATAGGTDHWFATERRSLDRSPAIAAGGRAALGHAGISIDDVAHLDLYSCFPSAVQVAAAELGIDLFDPSRAPTVTGGLTFAGGPANGYVLHALATLVERLRADPGAYGVSTAVGWYLTKHGIAVLGGPQTTPARGFAHHDIQAEVDATPRREVVHGRPSSAVVETHTALFDHDGNPTIAFATGLDDEGRRAVGGSQDPEIVAALALEDPLGRRMQFDGAGGITLL